MFAIVARDYDLRRVCVRRPDVGTDINSRASDPPVSTVPYNVLIRSASAMHAPTPRARSIVMCCPPTAKPEAWARSDRPKMSRSWSIRRPFRPRRRPVGLVVGQDGGAQRHKDSLQRHGLDVEVAALDHQHQVAGRQWRPPSPPACRCGTARPCLGVADAPDAVEREAHRQAREHGAALAGGMAHRS